MLIQFDTNVNNDLTTARNGNFRVWPSAAPQLVSKTASN